MTKGIECFSCIEVDDALLVVLNSLIDFSQLLIAQPNVIVAEGKSIRLV